MNRDTRLDSAPKGISTLDLLVFTAGFACGWVMHQRSAWCVARDYDPPLDGRTFRSLMGDDWFGWLWAFVTGLAFLIVTRPFRHDCRKRPAEWLAVALALVLFESVYYFGDGARRSLKVSPKFDSSKSVGEYEVNYSFGGRLYPANLTYDYPLTFELASPQEADIGRTPWWITPPILTAAAAIYAIAWSRFRVKASPGWMTFFAVTIAVLAVLGPIRLAEATSAEFPGYSIDTEGGPFLTAKPWRWQWLPVYLDVRAWAGYSLRALALMTLGLLATGNFAKRWRHWLWTEWTAFVSALIISGCWVYDEFVSRPALDRAARVVFLCTWIFVLAATAGGGIWVWRRLGRRFRSPDGIGQGC
jgi:hypothetical protein